MSVPNDFFNILIQQHDHLFQHVIALESNEGNSDSFPRKLLECLESDLELIGKTTIRPNQGDKADIKQMELMANTPPEDAKSRPFYFRKLANPGLYYSIPGTVAKVHACGWLCEGAKIQEASIYRKAKVTIYGKSKLSNRDDEFNRSNHQKSD
jgi:hypothetical protein